MTGLLNRVEQGAGRALWLDYVDYAGALLAGGGIPWLDVTACAALLRKAQGLLGSDVTGLPLARVCDAWLAAHPGLLEAMGARSRAVYPLKTLLADDQLRSHCVELQQAVRGSVGGTVAALVVPSPRAWVQEAFRQGHGTTTEAGDDEADSAAAYIADFLRVFGEAGVDAVLLEETVDTEPAAAADAQCYAAVLNVARHYRWDAGLRVPAGRYAGGESGFAVVIAPATLPGAASGLALADDFWTGSAVPAPVAGGFRYARIPPRSDPETVLERLALLR